MSENISDNNEKPIADIIQAIKTGEINPKFLTAEDRQQIVRALMSEGYNISQLAQVLQRSEKTIQRDLTQIRSKSALGPSPDLAKQIIGELFLKFQIHHGFLMRLARAKDSSIAEKAQAEFAAWRTLKEFIEKMQSLGYLPQRLPGIDLFHHLDDQSSEKTIQEVQKTVTEIIEVAKQSGSYTPELQKTIDSLNLRIEKFDIGLEAKKILNQQQELPKEEENDDRNN